MRDPDGIPDRMFHREMASRDDVLLAIGVRENQTDTDDCTQLHPDARTDEPHYPTLRNYMTAVQQYNAQFIRRVIDPSGE